METILVDGVETQLYVDGWLLDRLKNKWMATIKRDDDFVAVVDGGEGTGKSTFAFQIAKILDPNFCLDKICMNANEFKKRIKEAKKGDCIVYDEAFTGLSSKGALTEINKILVEMMMEMRQLNLKVIIVLPTFFMLEKYVALFRARCLFHVYRKRGSRGNWMFFGRKKKKLLYLLGKKFLSYKEPKSEKKGKFQGTMTVNEAAYRAKKAASFQNKDRAGREERFKHQRDALLWYFRDNLGISGDLLSDMMYFFDISLDPGNVSRDLKAFNDKIVNEIEHPPDDNFIARLLKQIETKNRLVMAAQRKKELEDRALAELAREKRLLGKAKVKKTKENSQDKALGSSISPISA